MPDTVHLLSKKVPLTACSTRVNLSEVQRFKPFVDWCERLNQQTNQDEFEVSSIDIQDVDYFKDKLGFVKMKVNAQLKASGKSVPGIVLLRGGSVSVLLILRAKQATSSDPKEYVVLTVQPRIPVGSLSFTELPAGMLDDSGEFSGTASRELEEETGLVINHEELIDMTELAYTDQEIQGAYTSPGVCDEFIRLFLCIKDIDPEKLEEMQGKLTGLRDEGENITLKLVELDQLWKTTADVKALSSLLLYQKLKEAGKL
ncbi:hypothetical protein K493DRAFT_235441 [Basidiobolus meristosporus CBS 931.73]|uniref:Nudix hydrolase domain-containing protein n=1 Tax=Basidiobolus meristosporus CBS 931.73 TaxID=1314790 RepID=A0A1Y1XSW6_9FUNG|nr:hypothetical protein K493DRAFT_235441 [Basidiobolus meristosporus CBS 931.73]|eukprot:ORX88830.1 hypothetical protein K493DRAFT_235441 [Basidiobolus meristosporus CBS 931.73]